MNLSEVTQQYDFSGRAFVIPGGAGILGGEMACALVGMGANVTILDRNPERAASFQNRLACGPGQAMVLYADALVRKTLVEACRQVQERFGAIYALINAAGGNARSATTSDELSFFDLPLEALQQVLNLNLMGSILPSQIFGQAMAQTGEGVIINISSMNSYRPLTRIPAYSAAKAGVNNFTQWLAVHIAQNYSPNIRVNAIAPGFFHTNQNHFLLYDEKDDSLTPRGRAILEHTPMARFGLPEDLLGALLWLASPLSRFVTGVVIPIDGGFSAYSGV